MPLVMKCCPVMKRWSCCCCSSDLRTAAVAMGWMCVVFSTIYVVSTAIVFSKEQDVLPFQRLWNEDYYLEHEYFESSIVDLVKGVMGTLLYGILLFGIHKKKPVFMLPSLVFNVICLITSMIGNTAYSIMVVRHLGKYGLIVVGVILVATAIAIYIWIIFYSYYRQLADEKVSIKYGVVNYTHENQKELVAVQNVFDPTESHLTTNNLMEKISA